MQEPEIQLDIKATGSPIREQRWLYGNENTHIKFIMYFISSDSEKSQLHYYLLKKKNFYCFARSPGYKSVSLKYKTCLRILSQPADFRMEVNKVSPICFSNGVDNWKCKTRQFLSPFCQIPTFCPGPLHVVQISSTIWITFRYLEQKT